MIFINFFLQYIFDLIQFWLFPFQIKYFDSIMKVFVKPYIFKQKHCIQQKPIKIKKINQSKSLNFM